LTCECPTFKCDLWKHQKPGRFTWRDFHDLQSFPETDLQERVFSVDVSGLGPIRWIFISTLTNLRAHFYFFNSGPNLLQITVKYLLFSILLVN
jgi:hypothetical protein